MNQRLVGAERLILDEQAEHKFEDFSRFLRRQAPATMMPDAVLHLAGSSIMDQVGKAWSSRINAYSWLQS